MYHLEKTADFSILAQASYVQNIAKQVKPYYTKDIFIFGFIMYRDEN